MLSRRKKKMKVARVDTILGRNSVIEGDLRFSGGMHLEGTIHGNISADDQDEDALLVINEGAVIKGDVKVPRVVISGSVEGDVHASARVELSSGAQVTGNVYYTLIEMAMGAEVNGNLVHQSKEALRLEHLKVPGESHGTEPPSREGGAEKPVSGVSSGSAHS
ncbi:cell shape determination protein CcmA [Ectothiorhodospira haloalkaliphila]|uniref:Cell shape determination protein CcmA n=1 Tax=Ectothiorhodospira haloalkaliphila TaxID=421628 RepID=W8KN16_9GAMM|nr:polymer-forming cytoskeletal protein [Ectothiorhodospira haloalkaliphila]AHK78412.1 cell shape determination protein CcmA [Ectothiorhodospira haloalkaliphila]MCG5525809.1 polymer-forming cytoskeletal protein [Ectothiorhodospira haloalkaliphila]